MVADAVLATAVVVTVKVAVVAPAATVTLAGTVAAALLLDKVTDSPPVGAALPKVTVPVDEVPPVTEVGFSVTDDTTGGFTVNTAVLVPPLKVAEMVADAVLATAVVVTVKVAVVAPAATVTLAGTVAAALLLDKVTDSPPVGAALPKVTVPVDEVPPVTEVGFSVTDDTTGGFTVNTAVLVPPLKVAEMVADAVLATAVVVTVKVAVVAPAATVTLAGTVAAALLLDKVTDSPPVGAALPKVTVLVDEVPPVTEVGFSVTEETAGGFTVNTAV